MSYTFKININTSNRVTKFCDGIRRCNCSQEIDWEYHLYTDYIQMDYIDGKVDQW